MGMWESHSDFQGRWEGWKTCFWFSRLSTGRHYHGFPLLVCFGSFLLLLGGSAKAIRFRTGLQDVSTVGDAIEKRLAKARSGSPASIPKTQIRGEDDGCFLRPFGHHLKQKLGPDLR